MSEWGDLPERLRSTTEQMANRCSVSSHLWDIHSNAVLEAADEIERLRSALRRVRDTGEDGTQEQLAPDMWKACREFASEALGDD